MYVNDAFFGADSIEEAISLANEFHNFLMAGGFPLRKYAANDKRLLDHLPVEWIAEEPINNSLLSENHMLLGLIWNPKEDNFAYSSDFPEVNHPITKRKVLSLLAKLYDPLGLLSPVTIKSKMFFQSLWSYQIEENFRDSTSSKRSLNWDDHLPENISKSWESIYSDLRKVQSLSIPRWLQCKNDSRLEIHGFSDASTKALSAVLYLRVLLENKSSVSIIAAKTKVAPVKSLSVPRLELCEAFLLSKLASSEQKGLNLQEIPLHLWTDSTVSLAWIQSSPHLWQTFVSHRVAEISNLVSSANWHHVEGVMNPADIASRGVSASELIASKLWWNGPDFLSENAKSYQKVQSNFDISSCPERRKSAFVVNRKISIEFSLVSQSSSFNHLIRVMAWVKRFITKSRSKASNSLFIYNHVLSAHEILEAEILCIKLT